MCLRAPYGENWKSGSWTKKLSARRLRESEAAGKSARAPFTSLASNKEPRTGWKTCSTFFCLNSSDAP
jgi:hypothetical protein